MSATTLPSQRDLPSQTSRGSSVDSAQMEDRLCPGCKRSALTEHGGLVVAFGQSFFHVDCFKCAKCSNQVNADTNLLLLSDGSPICANCSYSCNVCHLPILDEAIMTGDDSYHAHCFKCKVCDTRIDELVFAKTSHGIYCMNCHNKRMIKLREHAQKKAERAKEKAAVNGGSSTGSRERDPKNTTDNGSPSPRPETPLGNSHSRGLQPSHSSSNRSLDTPPTPRSPAKSALGVCMNDTFSSTTQTIITVGQSIPSSQVATNTFASPPLENESQQLQKQNMLPVPTKHSKSESDRRRRSYDDGVRPSNVLGSNSRVETNQHPSGMVTAPMSPSTPPGRDKRRSINPAALSPRTVPSVSASASLSNEISAPQDALSASTSHRDKRRSINPGTLLSEGGGSPASFRSPTSPSAGRLLSSPGGHDSPRRALSPVEEHSHDRPGLGSPASCRYDIPDQTVVVKSLPSITVGSVPPSKTRMKTVENEYNMLPDTLSRNRSGRSTKSLDAEVLPSMDDRHTGAHYATSNGLGLHQSPIRSRAASPLRCVDVPSGVESEMESDSEVHNSLGLKNVSSPLVPPKEIPTQSKGPVQISTNHPEGNLSVKLPEFDELSESEPVERTSHPTFIAPALPPIRISMNDADFVALLNSVGHPSLNSLQQLAEFSELNPVNIPTAHSSPNFDRLRPKEGSAINTSSPKPDQGLSRSPPVPPKPVKPLVIASRPSAANNQSAILAPPPSGPRIVQLSESTSSPRITVEEPEPTTLRNLPSDPKDNIIRRLRQLTADARESGVQHMKMDQSFVEAVLVALESQKDAYEQLKSKFDGIKRTSKQFIEGLSVAQEEYDRELKAKREAEAEVTRLRVLLSGQVARLTVMSGEVRKDEMRQRMSKELRASLTGLEQDLSNLKVERDMALAEVEELSASRSSVATSPDLPSVIVDRSLTRRFDSIKCQYKNELIPLNQQKESLNREIAELKAIRDVFLEETTVLNARNEELAQLNAVYSRRAESIPASSTSVNESSRGSTDRSRSPQQAHQGNLFHSLSSSNSISSTICEDAGSDNRHMKVPKTDMEHATPSKKFMKWPGSKSKEALSSPSTIENKVALDHNFQQLSILRFTRCDHCGDKMWGSQLRCTVCSTSIHARCIAHVQIPCAQQVGRADLFSMPLPPPSMFGRLLAEQVHADAQVQDEERHVPVIVEKCIHAVEALAMDYEGIYRKSGGSGQSKIITQLFERGNYNSFDLRDMERFNDICSVTSVLKNYFRSLPVPLLTFDLHEEFITTVHIKDPEKKDSSLLELVKLLPPEHYHTLEMLMLHLHRIHEQSEKNLMTARNLGVVFGPTLMRSRDPGAEFSDMAGKALSIEWLIENAPRIFNTR